MLWQRRNMRLQRNKSVQNVNGEKLSCKFYENIAHNNNNEGFIGIESIINIRFVNDGFF